MTSQRLEAMRQERDRLNGEILKAEEHDRRDWNDKLHECEERLGTWLRLSLIEVEEKTRKNEVILAIGNGALEVHLGYDEPDRGRGLSMTSGRGETLTLQWNHVPDPERMLAIVAVLLGRTTEEKK